MTIQVGLARSAEELDALYRVRHRVYVDEMGYFPPSPDGRLRDRFDALPTTGNFVARVDGRVVGGARGVLLDPDAGSPVSDLFDFAPHLPAGARVAIGGMLAMDPEGRATPHLTFVTIAALYHWCVARGCTHIAAVVAPAAEKAVLAAGFRALAPRSTHEETGLQMRPLLLDVHELAGPFRAFVERQRHPVFLASLQDERPASEPHPAPPGAPEAGPGPAEAAGSFGVPHLTRQLHAPGVPIVRAGEAGDEAYVLLDGEAEVVDADGTPLARLQPGDLFGEIALLTGGVRTRDVVARGTVELLVVGREDLRRAMRRAPPFAAALRATMAGRLAHVAA